MPCHPLEPDLPNVHQKDVLRCPSCGCPEGDVHSAHCPIYALPGAKRQIYFRPSQAVKDAMPYTPGERQAKAVIPVPPNAIATTLKLLAEAAMEYRRKNCPATTEHIQKAYDALKYVEHALEKLFR